MYIQTHKEKEKERVKGRKGERKRENISYYFGQRIETCHYTVLSQHKSDLVSNIKICPIIFHGKGSD